MKLFDFGLAKELKDSDRNEDGLYKLTGTTGSFRYMAPEVSLGKPYNLTADVYSWSMIMWFILALVAISVIASLLGWSAPHPVEIDPETGAAALVNRGPGDLGRSSSSPPPGLG